MDVDRSVVPDRGASARRPRRKGGNEGAAITGFDGPECAAQRRGKKAVVVDAVRGDECRLRTAVRVGVES